MISVREVIGDPDMIAPEPYTIMRSTGQWVLGGFQSTTVPIQQIGPVQQASDKEIQMIPEADRVGAMRSFWSVVPVYVTRGYAPVPGIYGEAPVGVVPGTVYALSQTPPGGVASVYVNGLLQVPGVDYSLVGQTITFAAATPSGAVLWVKWPITANVASSASDIIQFEGQQYRILRVYRDPGGGYWKAIGTRLAAA
jgi:hypothetical protein